MKLDIKINIKWNLNDKDENIYLILKNKKPKPCHQKKQKTKKT